MKALLGYLKEKLPQEIAQVYTTPRGDDVAVVNAAAIRDVAHTCKEDPRLDLKLFLSLCAVDRLLAPQSEPRFELVYTLRQGREPFAKMHLKAYVSQQHPELPSVQPVWRGADWWERYTYDFYGIRFVGHPDLRRILLYEQFEGHPLRKDYPLKGRQPLIPERNIPDIVRGPGAAPPAGEA
jgi:NADH-quinone oxidoreductase subunit C